MNAPQTDRRLRTPRENRGVVVDPPCHRMAGTIEENIESGQSWRYDFQGVSARQLIADARSELCAATVDWWKTYGLETRSPLDPQGPILLAGHQPQMFHPGVWLKNFALGRLAEKHSAAAVNLIIDSDAAGTPAILVPGGTVSSPSRESLSFDAPEPAVAFEERRVTDRAIFESFGRRASERISSLVKHPLLENYWPAVVEQSRENGLLGSSLARARHLLEVEWGSPTWEVPQSAVCDQPAFFRFAAHLFAQMTRFRDAYNAAVCEYRRLHKIRNRAHPVPDLTVEGDWQETPFWIWTAENPKRRRLFVRSAGRETILSDRRGFEARLSLAENSDAARAVEQLLELRSRGVKIRSRALVTTLWARLILGDFFIHGIGGGNYDHVTDAIIERFFGRTPPNFMVLSATLHLPIKRPSADAEDLESIDRTLREMTFHPERFADEMKAKTSGNGSPSPEGLIAEKRRLIETAQTVENAKGRCRSIRAINERLQPWLADFRSHHESRRESAVEEARRDKILSSREYAFCLFPEETIREFFGGVLKDCGASFPAIAPCAP
jgi:hypothetical protein